MTYANIALRDKNGDVYSVTFEGCSTEKGLLQLVEFLRASSEAKIDFYELVNRTFTNEPAPQGDTAYDTVNQQTLLLFVNEYGETVRVSIPAPKESTLDAAQQATSDIVKKAQKVLFSTCGYAQLTYRGGGLLANE